MIQQPETFAYASTPHLIFAGKEGLDQYDIYCIKNVTDFGRMKVIYLLLIFCHPGLHHPCRHLFQHFLPLPPMFPSLAR